MKKKVFYIIGIVVLLLVIGMTFILLKINKKETDIGDRDFVKMFNIPDTTGDIKTLYIVKGSWSGTKDGNNDNKNIEQYDI